MWDLREVSGAFENSLDSARLLPALLIPERLTNLICLADPSTYWRKHLKVK